MENSNPNSPSKKKPHNKYARFSGMVFQMMAIIAIGVYAGIQLDDYFNMEKPLLTSAMALISIITSMYYIFQQVKKG